MRRDGSDGPGRDCMVIEHPRLRHPLRPFPQIIRHHQQGSAALVHGSRKAQSGRPATSTHGRLLFGPLRQVITVVCIWNSQEG